jgi:hypothetical protein
VKGRQRMVEHLPVFLSLLSRLPDDSSFTSRAPSSEMSKDQTSDDRALVGSPASQAVSEALVHKYSRRYIAGSPHRMEQLLAAYQSNSPSAGKADDVNDEAS